MRWIKSVRRVFDGCSDCEYYSITYADGREKEVVATGKSQSFWRLIKILSTKDRYDYARLS